MNISISRLVDDTAKALGWEVHRDPLHGAQGIEFSTRINATDTIICVGYYLYDLNEIRVYHRVDSAKEIFYRNKLWFLYGWFIKPRPRDNQYRVLRIVSPAEFSDELFVEIAKNEFAKMTVNPPVNQ